MKIREDYLSFLFDEFKRDNQEMRTYGEVLNKIILFESTDFMKAMHIANDFKNEDAWHKFELELNAFNRGNIDCDYLDWYAHIGRALEKNKTHKTKQDIRERIQKDFDDENLVLASRIKELVIAMVSLINSKIQAKQEIESFARDYLQTGSISHLLEIVE